MDTGTATQQDHGPAAAVGIVFQHRNQGARLLLGWTMPLFPNHPGQPNSGRWINSFDQPQGRSTTENRGQPASDVGNGLDRQSSFEFQVAEFLKIYQRYIPQLHVT